LLEEFYLRILRAIFPEIQEKEARIKELEEEISRLKRNMHRDDMTGLFNYKYAISRMLQLARCQEFTLLSIDVDRFKWVNDQFGHPAGDKLLVIVAKLLQSSVRADDIVIRNGGDEFVIFLAEADLAKKDLVINRIRQSCIRISSYNRGVIGEIKAKNSDWQLSLSIGSVTRSKGDNRSLRELFKLVDMRMYEDKKRELYS